jgi:nucleotide-binding universal stress UspA family protein
MNLLVPVSGSKASMAAVRFAAAELRERRGEVILVNVQPLLPSYVARFVTRESRNAMRAERSAKALAEATTLLESAGVRYRTVATEGRVPRAIADAARQFRADQIVVGATRRASWWQALFSPVTELIDLADVPVSVVGEGRSGAFERYGVPACVGLGLTALALATE